jgi:hypothetical protein
MSETRAEEPFARRVERELYRRTGGRISGLEVTEDAQEILVSCTVPSFHVRQLVVIATMAALPRGAAHDVVLHVRVGPAPPLAKGSGEDGAWAGTLRQARPARE